MSSLELTRQLLNGLGFSDRIAARAITTFRTHDERRLIEDYKLFSEPEKLQQLARSSALTLEKLFQEDADEEAKLAKIEDTKVRPPSRVQG